MLGLALAVLLVASGCETTRHLERGQLLVRKPPRFEGARSLSTELLATGVKTVPNRKSFFIKLPLHLHSLGTTIARDSSPGKRLYRRLDKKGLYERDLVEWLTQRVGEAPRLVDSRQLAEDAANLESIYFGEGFLQARVEPVVRPRRSNPLKADVVFRIAEGPAYLIRRVRRVAGDTAVVHTVDSLIQGLELLSPGARYNEQRLVDVRNQIAERMRDAGYFRFGPEQISYIVDTLVNGIEQGEANEGRLRQALARQPKSAPPPRWVDIDIVLPDAIERCTIDEVHVSVRSAGQTAVTGETAFRLNRLTTELRRAYHIRDRWLRSDYDMVFTTHPNIARETDMSVIARRIRVRSGDPYSLVETRRTQSQVQSLGIFRSALLSYEGIDSARSSRLRANLDLALLRRWAFSIGAETFQSQDFRLASNLPGIGVTFSLLNRNLLGRAERFDLQTNGNISFFQQGQGQPTQTFFQFTVRGALSLPTFWLLETPRRNLLTFRPTTTFGLTFNAEQRPQFNRTTLSFDWGYQWFNIPFSTRASMSFSPITLTYVETVKKPDFQVLLNEVNPSVRQFILRDFQPRFFAKSTFYYTYSDFYGQHRDRPTYWLRAGVEYGGGGNLNDSTTNFKFVFGQFARLSAEVKGFFPLRGKRELVARLYVGVARPLFNRRIIPYENRFFSGGTNSVRGWQSSTLGPGTYRSDSLPINNLIAPGGEYLLEMNLEYRFNIVGALYGAAFLDAGNVWFSPSANFGDPRATLTASNLELGVAGGLGFRLDLTYFIFRLDFGQQLYAPDIRRWVVQQWPRDIGGSRMIWNIGLGFPF